MQVFKKIIPKAGVSACPQHDPTPIAEDAAPQKPEEVRWTFLFRNRPERTETGLETERIRLEIPEGMSAETEEIPVTDPRMARNWPGSLWRVRIAAGAARLHTAEWRFEKK